MIGYLRKRKLWKAFKQYVHILGPALVDGYGAMDQYTVKQVLITANNLKLDVNFISYAVALFRYEESENTVKILNVDQQFLDDLRAEIAQSIFDGNYRYWTSQGLLDTK
jgi:hypothetical protein